MADNDTSLPPGFVLQGSAPSPDTTSGGFLPPGFVPEGQPTPAAATSSGSSLPSGFVLQNSPNNGQPESAPQHLYQDSSQPLYKRGWDWLNTPLTESLFGLPEDRPGAGGFERGLEHVVSGLTSPLSLALTAATFGTGGLIESAGATALKESGEFTADQIADITKASQVALKATSEQTPLEPVLRDALAAGGHDPELLLRANKVFGDINRVTELAKPEIQRNLAMTGLKTEAERTAFLEGRLSGEALPENATEEQITEHQAAESKAREDIVTANGGFSDKELADLSKTGKTLEEAKLGFHPIEDAVRESFGVSPDTWSKATKALGDEVLGTPSGDAALAKAGFSPQDIGTLVKADKGVSTWKSGQDVLFKNGLTEHDLLQGNMVERGAFQVLKHVAPELPIATVARAAKTANTLLSTGFTLQQLESAGAMSPQFLDALKEGDYDKALEYGTEAAISGGLGLLGASHALHSAGELFKPLIETNKFRPNDEWVFAQKVMNEVQTQHAIAEQRAIDLNNHARFDILEHKKPGILGMNKEVKAKQDLELASVLHQVTTGGDTNKAGQMFNALSEATGKDDRLPATESPNNGQLAHQIETNVFKNQPKEYQDLVLNSLKRVAEGSLSEKELAAAKYLREEQDRNFEIGSSNDLLHHYLEDYMSRVWKDSNPQGNVILSDAKGGKFATRVSAAQQRVYDSDLTAYLKSPKQRLLDPVDITARGRAMLIKAAANKQVIDTLRDQFTRGSDGRPAVVLNGQGQVVSGPNGEDPKTFIDPNRVRKINIAKAVVAHLQQTGDLQRFLDEGTIKDITPYVHPSNIEAVIDRLEKQSIGKNAQYDEVGNNKLRTDLMYLKSMLTNKDFSGLKDFNDKLEKQYAWDPQDYIALDKQAMKGWNFVTNDSAGHGVFVRSDILAHPEFAQYLKDRLGLEPSDIAKHPIGKALLGAGTKLKETLLSLSPFHTVQIALRGLMTGINPFTLNGPDIIDGAKVDPSDPFSPTKIRKMVEHGLTTGTDYKALQEHSEGLSAGKGGLLRKIPGVGPILANSLNSYNDFLFKRFIPAVKATAAEHLFDQYKASHPDWSVDRVAKAAALHSNENFGGINWKAMGRSATTQDWGRLMLLAPDWLEGELRAGARLFNKDEGNIGRRQIAIMTMSLWGIARVLNLMNTGNAHYEAPFGLATRTKEGKEIIYSVRTLPEDLLHAATDPVNFIKGRLSPTWHTGQELISGRDNFGRKLQPEDLWADAFRSLLPIPVQSINQAISGTGPEVGNVGQFVKAIGGTAETYASPAQKFAADQASSHSEDGPLDPSAMARHRRVIELEDQARAGEISWPDLYKLTYSTDQLKESELKKIETNVKATQGMDASMASLYSRASRLPAAEYLQLLDVANPSEKAALVPLTIKVQKRYLTKAKKEETPDERAKDPVFQKFLRMIPGQNQQEAPQPQSSVVIPPAVQREAAYLYTATHPITGHRVGSNDGQNWVDHQTGVPVNG